MQSFLSYDHFRLENFKKRKPGIEMEKTEELSSYRFDEVGYFNYIFFEHENFDRLKFRNLLTKYINDGTKQIKLIFPYHKKEKFREFCQNDFKIKGIGCVKKEITDNFKVPKEKKDFLELVKNEKELFLYTKLYLEGFGSENTNVAEVAKNFALLHQTGKVDFFLIKHNETFAGICANYYDKKHVFLAACAILPPFMNAGLQKAAIHERIKIASKKGYQTITSWAYYNDISHQNLLKTGFTNYAKYGECLSKPIGQLLKNNI